MPLISPAALKRLQTLYGQFAARSLDFGKSRADRLAWASQSLGRAVASFGALSAGDGKQLIDALQLSMGLRETAPPRRRPASKRDAQKVGTEGRRDQIHAESTLLDGSEDVFRLIQSELTSLGWTEDRLRAWLRSPTGPNGGRDTIRTLGDANRVHYALKGMVSARTRRSARRDRRVRRPVHHEDQIDIFPQETMTELFSHPEPQAPLPPLPFARNREVDVARACKILGTHASTILRMLRAGALRSYPISSGRRSVHRIEYDSIVEYCDELRLRFGIAPRHRASSGRHPDDAILPFPMAETISTAAVENHLDVSKDTSLKLIEAGEFEAYRLLPEAKCPWRISRPSFAAYLRRLEAHAAQKPTTRSYAAAKRG